LIGGIIVNSALAIKTKNSRAELHWVQGFSLFLALAMWINFNGLRRVSI